MNTILNNVPTAVTSICLIVLHLNSAHLLELPDFQILRIIPNQHLTTLEKMNLNYNSLIPALLLPVQMKYERNICTVF